MVAAIPDEAEDTLRARTFNGRKLFREPLDATGAAAAAAFIPYWTDAFCFYRYESFSNSSSIIRVRDEITVCHYIVNGSYMLVVKNDNQFPYRQRYRIL